jgi:transcription initiation factor TFIID TATA-box-binding protein
MEEHKKINFKIENIVASANLAVELDLYGIAREVDNVEYEPEQFPGAILKLKEPKTSLLLFKNGKLICTGAKSEGEVEAAINKAYELIKNCINEPAPEVKHEDKAKPAKVKHAKKAKKVKKTAKPAKKAKKKKRR